MTTLRPQGVHKGVGFNTCVCVYVWVMAQHEMHVGLHLVVGGVERMHGACVRLLLLLLSGACVLPHRYCCLASDTVSDTVPCHWQPGHVFFL